MFLLPLSLSSLCLLTAGPHGPGIWPCPSAVTLVVPPSSLSQQGEGTSRAQGRGFVPLAPTPARSERPVSRPLRPSRLPGLWLWSGSGGGTAIIDRGLGGSVCGSLMFGCAYTFVLFVGVPIILVYVNGSRAETSGPALPEL